MKLSEAVKPISYFKAHASEVIRDVSKSSNPVVITLNGEAKVILQDIKEYEKVQQSLALLKILAQSSKSLREGRFKPAGKVFASLRTKVNKAHEQ